MKNDYDPKEIEPKWQAEWEKSEPWKAEKDSKKPKYYTLVEFPYPSGEGLHTGHVRSYTALDIIARKRRREGFNVLYPIGWDAFGLPAENYAIKTGIQPAITTAKNIDNYRAQLKRLGIWFDWSREVDTTDPKYYKWTQWLFLKFFEHGLAYKDRININWCPKDKIGLANEEVVNGKCERCGTAVEKREKEQWMLRITKYAERLDKDLDDVDYQERIKLQQKNWIGKSEGVEISFEVEGLKVESIQVFTTRPDTIFGATFIAIAPEIAKKLIGKDFGVVSETDRENKEKIGVDTGLKAKNPASGELIPVWVVNYVSADYGTGAIMAVPAHDERDFEFATKFGLPVKQVVAPVFVDKVNPTKPGAEDTVRKGVLVLVKHWSEDKYLLDYAPKFGWKCLFTGGIKEGEDPLEAAKREVGEETGYQNIKSAAYIPLEHIDKFHAPHKGVNRTVYQKNIYIELLDGEQKERTQEEKDLHHIEWLTADEMRKSITLPNHLFVFDTALMQGRAILSEGALMNSASFDNHSSEDAKKEIVESVGGKWVTKFKLRDWVFSRQRYWGEPIPMIHCEKDGWVPVPEKDLPVELPKVEMYEPTDSGESPLANISEWVNTTCPKCGGAATRETDTMPNWAGSSWYFLRYADPHNDKDFASKDALEYWLGTSKQGGGGVDWYNGGMEHTTLHLLYSRFWNKFLFDIGLVPTSEPYKKRTSHGLILAEGGVKMSKSLGNVINPDTIVAQFGADTLRLYEMFMGPFDQAIAWSEASLVGPRRFIEKVWKLAATNPRGLTSGKEVSMHQTIKKVSEDIESMSFNTAVSALMIWVNDMEKRDVSKEEFETLVKLLAPFAPHVTEELWQSLGHSTSIHTEAWPTFDPEKLQKERVTIAIQINGKVRTTIDVPSHLTKDKLERLALELDFVDKWTEGKEIKKVIVVPGKVVNIVTT